MAVTFTFTKLGATNNRLAYLVSIVVDGGSTSGTATLSNATMVADCVDGPLKDFIQNTVVASAPAAQTAFLGSHTLNIVHLDGGDATVAACQLIPIFSVNANRMRFVPAFTLTGAANNTYDFLWEMVFNYQNQGWPPGH